MSASSALSKIILPFIEQFQCDSLLVAGETANVVCESLNDNRSHSLLTPFSLSQFKKLEIVDLAIVSDLIENSEKTHAMEWLGILKNRYTKHIVLFVDNELAARQGWLLADFLSMGFKLAGGEENIAIFSYALENYQFNHDWLNSRFWANPNNFNKYRW